MTDTQQKKKSKKQKKLEEEPPAEEDIDQEQLKDDYVVKPSNEKAKCDTSTWPLLLKVIILQILVSNIII